MIFDSHAHYDDTQFDSDRESLLGSLAMKNVIGVINCSASLESNAETVKLCDKFDFMYGSAGIHPGSSRDLPSNYLEIIEKTAKHEKIVAIGECGLDYYYDDMSDRETQKEVFENQLKLAERLNLPLILHDRDAHGDMMDFLNQYKPKGVLHCFSGSKEMAIEVTKLGLYIGIGGVVTFKNAKAIIETVQAIPMEKILLETDCPYLSPEPFRGKRNDSSNISYVAQKIADLKGISKEDVLRISHENIKALFNI